MDFDWTSGTTGACLGFFAKTGIDYFVKRSTEKNSNKRKQLTDQCSAAKSKVSQCLQWSVEYLTSDCTEARRSELGRSLRHECLLLGQAVRDVNLFAADFQQRGISGADLIAFRKSATWHLDDKAFRPRRHGSPEVNDVYKSGTALIDAFNRLQHACA